MSADKLTTEFTIRFNLEEVSFGHIVAALQAAAMNHATILGDTHGMGKAHIKELRAVYGLNIQAAEKMVILGPVTVHDDLAELQDRRLNTIVECALKNAAEALKDGETESALRQLEVAASATSIYNMH